jgi:hypothetical protein
MKVKIDFSNAEFSALKSIYQGLKPFLVGFGANFDNSFDYKIVGKDNRTSISWSVSDIYTEGVLRAYGEYLPCVASAFMSLASSLRGLVTRMHQIGKDVYNQTSQDKAA